MNNQRKILVFSEDKVFTTIIKYILQKKFNNISLIEYLSLTKAKTIKDKENADLIIIDDIISGTTSLELIRFLRINKKITSPIYYFSIAGKTEEYKALLRGANLLIDKPFNPDEFVKLINSIFDFKN